MNNQQQHNTQQQKQSLSQSRNQFLSQSLILSRPIKLCILVLLVLFCAGCQRTTQLPEDTQEGAIKLYFLNSDGTKIVSEPYYPNAENGEALLQEMISALDTEPKQEGNQKAKPDTVIILDYSYSTNGLVTLKFDVGYQSIIGTAEVLMRAAIIKTLCQLETVEYVEFYVNDQPLMRSNGRPVGMMKEEDFIDNTGSDTQFYQNAYVSVYYSNTDGTALVESNLKITYDGTISTEQLILNQLIKGPVEENMRVAIPEGTVVNKVVVKDGTCFVDFNEKFLEKRSDVSEEVTIYSVVNSLAELSNIYRVQFTINGETQKNYLLLDLSGTFERNLDIIEGEH